MIRRIPHQKCISFFSSYKITEDGKQDYLDLVVAVMQLLNNLCAGIPWKNAIPPPPHAWRKNLDAPFLYAIVHSKNRVLFVCVENKQESKTIVIANTTTNYKYNGTLATEQNAFFLMGYCYIWQGWRIIAPL